MTEARWRGWILPVLLVLEMAWFTYIGAPEFHTPAEWGTYFKSYFGDLVAQSAPILLLAFGMTWVIATAGIDLSVGSMVALIACVMSGFSAGTDFWWKALPVGIAMGGLLGIANGWLISKWDVPPIIATLGTMIFYRGLCFVIMGDLERSPFLDVPGYEWPGSFLGASGLVALVYGLGGFWFTRSRWRREVFLIGGNRVAARYAAIPVSTRLIQVYGLLGLLSFVAAWSFTSRNGSVSASSLTGLELRVVVAVVLGGTPVQGGKASLFGTFMGVLLIAVLDEGLRGASQWGAQHLPFKISHLQYVLLGVLLIFGVWLQDRARARSSKPRN